MARSFTTKELKCRSQSYQKLQTCHKHRDKILVSLYIAIIIGAYYVMRVR